MGSQKLKPAIRDRRSSPQRPRRGTATRKAAAIVPFGVVPAASGHSRAELAAAEVADVKATVERQGAQLEKVREALRLQMESLTAIATAPPPVGAGDVLEATLRQAHATLTHGLELLNRVVGAAPDRARRVVEPSIEPFVRSAKQRLSYDDMKDRIATAARAVVPEQAIVIVVSRGDEALVDLDGRKGWHFPQNDDGVYAGYHPASSRQAIRHLEALRGKGGKYLVFPATAAWWLDHYGEFRRHLDSRYRLVFAEPGHCAIYDVRIDRTAPGDPS
jgi:hypothetical protein